MDIRPIPVAAVIGSDDRGRAYAISNPTTDPYAQTARERLVVSYGLNEAEELVVRSRTRNGTSIRAALDAAVMAGVSRDVHTAMAAAATRPDQAEAHEVLFEVGGPAEGKVVDPDLYEAARDVFAHAKGGVLEQAFPDRSGERALLEVKAKGPFTEGSHLSSEPV
ncbi:MAG: hypothetical protein NXI18_22055 [Alphaproteobacteria bacterium]|nr:hypothetical protein [Alphaproteobacteria bacterium]